LLPTGTSGRRRAAREYLAAAGVPEVS
jgi:hypothetical protein